MQQRLIAALIILALVVAAVTASEAAKSQGVEAPPPRSAATDKLVATKTCLDQFDALVAQRMPDRMPGEIRAIVNEGETYEVAPSRTPDWVWAFPTKPGLGTIKVGKACFE